MHISALRVMELIENSSYYDAELEDELDLPPLTIEKWRSGRSTSFLGCIHRIAEFFEVPLNSLNGNIPLEVELQILNTAYRMAHLPDNEYKELMDQLNTILEDGNKSID